ncbi:protease inhibitor I9 family protein [Streptomyces sp. NPDC059443]|uniref:protease inhibitor I9 family protein n=1 Tax=unclassified Streptomyces TaxID=2593676 RepID=UPI0036A6054A
MRTRLSRALPVAVAVAAAALAAATALPAAAATATAAAVREPVPHAAPADHAPYIVTVRRDLDPADVAGLVGATPVHVYRTALHGFAARLSPAQVTALRAMPAVVESVEEDGRSGGFGGS